MKSYHFIGPRRIKLLYTLLLLAAALLVFWALTGMRRQAEIPGYYAMAEGTVAESGSARMARVRFPLQSGEPFTAPIPPAPGRPDEFYREGESLLVYYNPVSPTEMVVEKRRLLGGNALLFLGIILGGFGFRLLVAELMRGVRQRIIREHGRRISPHRVEVRQTAVRLMLILQYTGLYLHCEWDGPGQYGTRSFSSELFPPRMRERIEPSRTEVYFLENNPAVYFIPLPEASSARTARKSDQPPQ